MRLHLENRQGNNTPVFQSKILCVVNLKGHFTVTAAKSSNILTWRYGKKKVRFPYRTLHLLAVHGLTCLKIVPFAKLVGVRCNLKLQHCEINGHILMAL